MSKKPKMVEATWRDIAVAVDDHMTKLSTENEKLRAALNAAARALHKAGEQFAFYANQHAAAGTADGDQKAATNQKWAQRCFDAHDAALGEKE